MFERLILCATHDRLIAGRWRLGRLREVEIFSNQAQGHLAFAEFLAGRRFAPIYLMVDAQEEDFHLETLPHTSGRSRAELLQRKLNQSYRGTVFRAAQFLNRERDKRRDDRFLFVALNNTEFLQPWLDIISQQQAPLAGVYSLPMVSQLLLNKLKYKTGDILFSEQLSSGLRQSYLHQGRLRLSRLVQIPPEAHQQIGYFHLVETDKARLYLLSQRLITRETALKVVVLTPEEDAGQISRNIQQEQGLQCEPVDLIQLAKSSGLPLEQAREVPELVHMQLLARGYRPDNLAPGPLVKTYRMEFLRKALVVSALMVALLGLLLTLLYLVQSIQDTTRTNELAVETRIQEQRYNEVANNFPATPVQGMDLQVAAHAYEAILRQEASPARMMQVLGAILNQMSTIQLNRLRWVMSQDLNIKDEEGQATAQPTQASQSGEMYQIGFVTGEIRGFNGDYRAALETVQQFAEALKVNPTMLEVAVVQQPVNVSSYSSLQGSTSDARAAQNEKAVFKLKLVLKPEARQ
ncbi:hypothetical protein [Methylobacillus sp.]|uniref:hypothetical protein n=1 Tax=Methylobacillus sp. TaxID=56818 RepID=UPI002FE3629F